MRPTKLKSADHVVNNKGTNLPGDSQQVVAQIKMTQLA